MGNKSSKSSLLAKSDCLKQQCNNSLIELLTFGYINELFTELRDDKSYTSILKLSVPNIVYDICLSMYGLTKNRHIFQIENLSNHTCNLSHKTRIFDKSIHCNIKNKALFTNSSYNNSKSLYIHNIKCTDFDLCDVVVLCGTASHYASDVLEECNYYASMITITDDKKDDFYACDTITATCSVMNWYSYWNPDQCSNLTYDKQYGLIIAIYNVRKNYHSIYCLKLFEEYAAWKELLSLKNEFDCNDKHIFIQMVYKHKNKYLFVSNGNKTAKLFRFASAVWIDVGSNNVFINELSKICYDDLNDRIYFIDISYCCYFDINEYKWNRIPSPGFFSTEEDIVCIKDYNDRQDLMIIGRYYYFTYNVKKNEWYHRKTLDRDDKQDNHDSYVLV